MITQKYRVTGKLTVHDGWKRKGDVAVSVNAETVDVDEVVIVDDRGNAKMAAWHKVLRRTGRKDGYWHDRVSIERIYELTEAPEDLRLRAAGAPTLPGLE